MCLLWYLADTRAHGRFVATTDESKGYNQFVGSSKGGSIVYVDQSPDLATLRLGIATVAPALVVIRCLLLAVEEATLYGGINLPQKRLARNRSHRV